MPPMRGMADSIGRGGGLLPSTLALLLLFRLLIPSGYMIAHDLAGAPGLVLCAAPAQPAEQLHPGHDGHPVDPAPPASDERPCAYAALAAPPIPPEAPALPPPSFAGSSTPEARAGAQLGRIAPGSPLPPARGPPITV